ncbi:Sodium-dependent transporter NaDC-1 [Helicobacter ailurogastricus]|uniref:SLC13 family permease n=1 Tax=Helicobacter ailurogastricus TaxID=1578720 RepID=UPI00244D8DB5|nr:DASS family sodium-coupled anion symporter [Helicobacter ailurogastricus]GMB89411.1 Sodium-dependent transporter NaDC-1 [Helicobacter ailurogastricus]
MPQPSIGRYIPWVGFVVGLALALLVYFSMSAHLESIQHSLNQPKLKIEGMPFVAAVAVLMGVWWMSEAIELVATALLPLVLFTLFGVADFKEVGASYASPIIFLFMGGFVLAMAMQKWNLHTRIALNIIALVGTSPRALVAGFMLATAFLSMWVSNTATAVMMMPVGLSVLQLVAKLLEQNQGQAKPLDSSPLSRASTQGGILQNIVDKGQDAKTPVYRTNFSVCLMLGIAYSASIGSLGTLIGTPPNALLAGYMQEALHVKIDFGKWMLFGVPLSLLILFGAWALLTYVIFPIKIQAIPGGKEMIKEELKKLGRMGAGERWVAFLFLAASLSWIFLGSFLHSKGIKLASVDSIIAMAVAVLLFIVPAQNARLIDWNTMKKLPWDVLLLFGGGLALSAQFSKTGLSLWIGKQVALLGHIPLLLLIVLVTTMVICLTEITSNTATAAAFLPVVGGVALGLGFNGAEVLLLTIPVALAATCAFMLPVATPPNAIAYGSGYLQMKDMIKAGLWLNLISIVLISAFAYGLVDLIFVR